MELRQLKTFTVAAENLNFTRNGTSIKLHPADGEFTNSSIGTGINPAALFSGWK
jgi:hypothetical protein